MSFFPTQWTGLTITIDDVVYGRRISHRATDVGVTTLCQFEPLDGRTSLTITHSFWSWWGIGFDLGMNPLVRSLAEDFFRRTLEGLKRRLEGRDVACEPKVFFHIGDPCRSTWVAASTML
jgi:hypothetical protein